MILPIYSWEHQPYLVWYSHTLLGTPNIPQDRLNMMPFHFPLVTSPGHFAPVIFPLNIPARYFPNGNFEGKIWTFFGYHLPNMNKEFYLTEEEILCLPTCVMENNDPGCLNQWRGNCLSEFNDPECLHKLKRELPRQIWKRVTGQKRFTLPNLNVYERNDVLDLGRVSQIHYKVAAGNRSKITQQARTKYLIMKTCKIKSLFK